MWGFFVQSLMEYTRLTKEQFKALHKEFSIFLATQSIDKEKWNLIKAENPDLTNKKPPISLSLPADLWCLQEHVYRNVRDLRPMNLFIKKFCEGKIRAFPKERW